MLRQLPKQFLKVRSTAGRRISSYLSKTTFSSANSLGAAKLSLFSTQVPSWEVRLSNQLDLINYDYPQMVSWLESYVNKSKFLEIFEPDDLELKLIAEAVFWSVQLGLAQDISQMSYQEIAEWNPLKERLEKTDRANKINQVCKFLKKPEQAEDLFYALRQAADCIYIHHHSFEKYEQEKNEFYGLKSKKLPR